MALPNEIRSMPLIMGNDAVDSTNIKLLPANATSNTSYKKNGNSRILFNIPAYANSFINPKRTYLSFKGKCVDPAAADPANNALGSGEVGRFVDGLPVFERMVIRSGGGVLLEDIQDYHIIERILNNTKTKQEMDARADIIGDRRGDLALYGSGHVANISTEDESGRIFTKDLLSGVLGSHQDQYIPIGLFETSGGFSFQIELYLADNSVATRNDKSGSGPGDVGYELTDVKLNMEVVQFEDEVMRMFNQQVLQGNAINMPFKTFRLHQSQIPANQDSVDINIVENAHNVDKVYTVLLPQNYTQQLQLTGSGSLVLTDTTALDDNLSFEGGVRATNKVSMYQYRYGTKFYPAEKVENNGTLDTLATFFASMSCSDYLYAPYWIAGRDADGNRNWENNFFIVQSFKTFAGKNVLNGLNTSSTGAPIQLYLKLHSPASGSLSIMSFVETTNRIHIKAGGHVTMIDG